MTLEEEKILFRSISKRILKENLSTNEQTLSQYKVDIIGAHNHFINYVTSKYELSTPESKAIYKEGLIWLRSKIRECFEKLKVFY